MERYDASDAEEDGLASRVALSQARASERSPLIGDKGKQRPLSSGYDDDVVFSVAETTATPRTDGAYQRHYAQVSPKSYQFKALFRKNFKLQVWHYSST